MSHELTNDERDRLARMCGGVERKHKQYPSWKFPKGKYHQFICKGVWLRDQDVNHVMMVLEALVDREIQLTPVRTRSGAYSIVLRDQVLPSWSKPDKNFNFKLAVCQAALEVDKPNERSG